MECLTAIATGVVSKLGELAVDPIVNQFKYMVRKDKIMANLTEEHGKLKATETDLKSRVDADRRNGYKIKQNVQKWLDRVEDVGNDLERFFQNEASQNKRYFGGKCPNLAFNYSLGKRATEWARVITSLKDEENNFKSISYPKSPPRIVIAEDIKALASRKSITKDVMEKLKDESIRRVSICGMGGVGKTTLVKEVIKIVETSKLFDEVVMATVSQDPNYEKIQDQIADGLGMRYQAKSIEGRAGELHKRVNVDDKRVLIVLDDVWDELDFGRIGLPSLENQKGCKIIFTSRDAKVCQKMRSQVNNVHVLSDDEAWYLFQEMAGDVVNSLNINNIAKEVAKECGGLPLALVIVARALGGEEQPAWENALQQLRNAPSSSFPDVQKLVYSRIKQSFNFLSSEEQKFCLMLCGLFPEDFDIPVESLMRLGMGMGMFKVDGPLRNTRNLVHTLIGHLKKCFLLLDSDKPECVKMHDVVRDVVMSIASEAQYGHMIQYNAELKRPKEGNLDHVKAISLILDDTKGLENAFLEHPTLQLLQVRSKSKEQNPWSEHFFRGMNKLKVLALENLGIPTLPSSFFQASTNLHTLQVQYCDVGDISTIGKELKNLQVLSFAHSNIKEIPIEIGELGSLKLLDLTGCDYLYFVSTNVFRRLSQLQELYFGVRNFPWVHHQDVLMELQSLSNHLKVIEFKVRKVETLPKNLTFENLENFLVSVVPYSSFEGYLVLNTLDIQAAKYKSIKCNLMIKELFKKCEVLILTKVEGLKNVICELDDLLHPLARLKDLRIHRCPNLEYVFDGIGPSTTIPQIQSLSLSNLGDLREIFNASDHHDKKLTIKFLNLVELNLECLPCFTGFISNAIDLEGSTQPIDHEPELSNVTQSAELSSSLSEPSGRKVLPITGKLFSTKWLQQFPKLETLSLVSCDSLEMIFELQENSQLNDQSNVVLFPQLKQIEMRSLSKLIHVWGNAPNYVQGFQTLRSMKIHQCDSLRYVFSPAIVRALTMLETLEVSYCKLIENLVDDHESKDEEKKEGNVKITFDRLAFLSLQSLPNIASI